MGAVENLVSEAGVLDDFIEQFEVFAGLPGGVEKLREVILKLAVMGKLSVQTKDDEPVERQIERIAKSREIYKSNLKKKPRKKQKNSDKENDLTNYFPAHWVSIQLSDLVEVLNGRAYKKNELLDSGTPVLRVGNLFTSDQWYYSDLELEDNKYCDNGDLLYAWSASFNPFIWSGGKCIYHYHIWKLDIFAPDDISKEYLYFFLLEKTQEIKASGHGIAMIHMTKEKMEKLVVPLPPLEEQKRIVTKVDELMALCDTLEAQQQQQANNVLQANTAAINALLNPSETHADFQQNWQRIAQNFHTLYGSTPYAPT